MPSILQKNTKLYMMQSDRLCNKRLRLSQVYDIPVTLRPTGVWLELFHIAFACLYCIVGVSYCQ